MRNSLSNPETEINCGTHRWKESRTRRDKANRSRRSRPLWAGTVRRIGYGSRFESHDKGTSSSNVISRHTPAEPEKDPAAQGAQTEAVEAPVDKVAPVDMSTQAREWRQDANVKMRL